MKIFLITFVLITQILCADSNIWSNTKDYTLNTIEKTKDYTLNTIEKTKELSKKAYDTTIEYTQDVYESSKKYGEKGANFTMNIYDGLTKGMNKEVLVNTAVVTALAIATVSSGGATAPALLSVATSVPALSKMINENNLSKILIKGLIKN